MICVKICRRSVPVGFLLGLGRCVNHNVDDASGYVIERKQRHFDDMGG